jgi:hypothetical protein
VKLCRQPGLQKYHRWSAWSVCHRVVAISTVIPHTGSTTASGWGPATGALGQDGDCDLAVVCGAEVQASRGLHASEVGFGHAPVAQVSERRGGPLAGRDQSHVHRPGLECGL